MRLKKLKIIGFKSFADKISLDFDCEIVGIVGPNGCGKSNIVDAFRWVMGEQSAKSLRGDKMYDVLFAGTDRRKPLNMAEVSVTLSEINGELPIEYDEITITRRLYRSGESEYLINKQQVRLKDIQSLFLGSGMGKNTFSIFEQGKLDQVIHLNPTERRAIFDEAAGIGRFLLRKKETMRKLSQVSDNYLRVHDVHQEVEKQTKQLKRQAAQAQNFQANKERLEQLEKSVLVTRWRTLSEKHSELDSALHTVSEEVKQERSRLVAMEEHLVEIKSELKEHELRAKEEQQRLHEAQTKMQVRAAETKQRKEQLEQFARKQKALVEERKQLETKRQKLGEQIERQADVVERALAKKEALEADVKHLRAQYTACEQKAADLRKTLREARETHLNSVQKESELQLAAQALQSVEAQLEEKKASESSLKKELVAKEKEVKALLKQIDTLTSSSGHGKSGVSTLKEEIARGKEQLKMCEKHQAEARARQTALTGLKEAAEGFSKGAKALLEAHLGVRPLVEVLKPKKGLTPALHPYAYTLVVDDVEAVLAYADEHNLSDFSLVQLDKKRFLDKITEADLRSALKAKEAVTPEGLYVDPKGVVFRFTHKESSPFLREAELEDLARRLKALDKEHHMCASFLEQQEAALSVVEEQRRRLEMDHVQENFALQRLRSDVEECGHKIAALQEKSAGLPRTKGLESQQRKSSELLAVVKKHEAAAQEEEERLGSASSQWNLAQATYTEALSGWQSADQQLALFKAQAHECEALEQKIVQENEELKQREADAVAALESRVDGDDQSKLAELLEKAQAEEAAVHTRREAREELEMRVTEKRESLGILEKKRHKFEVTLAQDSAQKASIEQELLERHGITASACEVVLEGELKEAEEEVRKLRVSIDRAGAVNMTAIEEYEEQAKRFADLDRQMVDLEEAKSDLEKIIGKLDGESRKIFKETFAQIRENFKKNFSILFNGGEADLTFTESPDVLEAGIEIVAKPPGKQMRSISLLSGGEKCLTALALLFSIFEVRPAPFCILDEVDAPLDDSNIERFTNVLQQYIDKTQFIIVTHNKKTMSIADLLLGVSMEEKGVSKLLSLAFEKNKAEALV